MGKNKNKDKQREETRRDEGVAALRCPSFLPRNVLAFPDGG